MSVPLFIRHRINRVCELASVPLEFGVEIDLRSRVDQAGKIHLSHDPWQLGDDFEDWLNLYCERGFAGPLILNTKEDGLEARALEILSRSSLKNYFFLDTALPSLVQWAGVRRNSNFAVRISRYEDRRLAEVFAGKAEWLWVDCFGGIPMEPAQIADLKCSFRICLVSPELQGASTERICDFRELYPLADAICTKRPEIWLENH